jgi:signal peptidase I
MRTRTLLGVGAFAAAVVTVRLAVLTPYTVPTASMSPAVGAGDTVLVDRVTPRLAGWHRGDVVALEDPAGEPVLKRIVGLPGETVALEDAVLVVDGRPVAEPWADNTHLDGVYTPAVRVPADAYFLLGDNRGDSVDSREWGPVPGDALTGRMVASWSL